MVLGILHAMEPTFLTTLVGHPTIFLHGPGCIDVPTQLMPPWRVLCGPQPPRVQTPEADPQRRAKYQANMVALDGKNTNMVQQFSEFH